MVQKQSGHPVPRYDLMSHEGTPHQPVFQVKGTAPWNGEEMVEEGQGNTRKVAEKKLQRNCCLGYEEGGSLHCYMSVKVSLQLGVCLSLTANTHTLFLASLAW